MLLLETIAVLATLMCVVLTYRESILCWPFGLVGIVAYLAIFFEKELYAEAVLQLIFIIQSLYGWYNWGKGEILEITRTTFQRFLFDIIDYFICSLIIIYSLNLQFLDVITAMYSILATKYLIFKKVQAWWVWIGVDILMVAMFIDNEMYLSAILYGLLLGLAINGLLVWRRKLSY